MMPPPTKICFVIMGFGKKTDFSTGKTLDLDKTYKNIIRPAVVGAGFQCVRADEVQDSGLIDKSMYALLIDADLVIADISTYNPNAIYELGIRHAVRPYATIIIKEKDGKIPFDLDHTRIFSYTHLGDDIGADEAKRCQSDLKIRIEATTNASTTDSPLYDYIQDIEPLTLSSTERTRLIGDLSKKEGIIFAIVEKAEQHMKMDEFSQAAKLWKTACSKVPTETYFIQQHALATYKAKEPDELLALHDALNIIQELEPDGDTNDPETLGLTGAIYKRMWLINKDIEFLKRAIIYYKKGFQIRSNSYTGENYALCLDEIGNIEEEEDDKTYYAVEAKRTRKEILKSMEELISIDEENANIEDIWSYATLANCHYGLGDATKGDKYEAIFLKLADADWKIETYRTSKDRLIKLTQ